MIAIRGIHSNIAHSLISRIDYLDPPEEIYEIKRDVLFPPFEAERYFICQGILNGKKRIDQTNAEIELTYNVNYRQIVRMCDLILDNNNKARICVVGSESGVSGSYDEIYADSKKLLHQYVETKHTLPYQQLVCIAPSIIGDAGMTIRRRDFDNLLGLCKNHPKGRFLNCDEVGNMAFFLLYEDLGYTTGVIIRMNGGKHVK